MSDLLLLLPLVADATVCIILSERSGRVYVEDDSNLHSNGHQR